MYEQIGVLSNGQGNKAIKHGDFVKAEDCFLKAKQATEVFREDSTPLWDNYPE